MKEWNKIFLWIKKRSKTDWLVIGLIGMLLVIFAIPTKEKATKESHFKTVIVSQAFAGLRPVQRHQKVYAAAGDLLAKDKIHALAIHAFLPEEWAGQDTTSPACAHAPKN